MPPHSRAPRKRRQPNRPPVATAATPPVVDIDQVEFAATPVAPAVVPVRAQPTARRSTPRPAPEPVDYTRDYRAATRDLQRIVFWSILLFGAMFALRFAVPALNLNLGF